uniref:Uncharacterized protein n=1 Tax=Oryza brachyantha TaxID=4533 RepID=J3MSF4_ORYBR
MSVLISSEEEISSPGVLSQETIEKMGAEVERLTKLKARRLKEIFMKKRLELEEICKTAHIEPDASTAPEQTNEMIDSGTIRMLLLLHLPVTAVYKFYIFLCMFHQACLTLLSFWRIEHPLVVHEDIASYEVSPQTVQALRKKQAIMKKCTPRRVSVEVANTSIPASNTRSKKKL